jgi:acyl dehydratase
MVPTAADIVGRTAGTQIFTWEDRDYLLYALALGCGDNAMSEAGLPFVYERSLKVIPTLPSILAWIVEPTFASLGAHPDYALHSGQKVEIHRPVSQPASVAVTGRVVSVQDKGPGRGAVIVVRQDVTNARDGEPIATLTTTCFARDSGGCGSAGEDAPSPHVVPSREPEHRVQYQIRPDAALLYRLTGDRNPLHADPSAARAAGFTRPILHGLCTFGMTCRAVLERIVAWQPERIATHEARFTAPVYPGDTLEIAMWQDGSTVSFQATVPDRGVTALSNGKAVLR